MSDSCVICGAAGSLIAYGTVAPFIVELAGLGSDESRRTSLMRCDPCDFVWYAERYDDATLAAIYSEYRDDGYVRTRRRWEPWYRASVNNAYDPGSPQIVGRTAFMTQVLGATLDIQRLRSIADYGGDMGQFFPPEYPGPKFVIEVSGKPLLPGVTGVESLRELPEPPNLVICAHLLEHLPDPGAVVREIAEALPDDGYLYVEVPLDRPAVHGWHATTRYRSYLARLASVRPAFVAADFATGVARNLGRAIPRLGAVKESEHINYYSARSMRVLIEQAGFRVAHVVEDPQAKTGGLRMGRMGVLAIRAA
jgi:Methyltransferase domain